MESRFTETIHYRYMRLFESDPPSLVSLQSYRDLYHKAKQEGLPVPVLERNGGATVSIVKNDKKGSYHIGISLCNDDDWYDRELGQKFSLDRAQDAARKNKKFGMYSIKHETIDTSELLSHIVSTIPVRYLFDNDRLSNQVEMYYPICSIPILA